MAAKYVFGDHGTIIRRHIQDEKGTALDITGGSIILRWMRGSVLEERPMVITDALNGVCEYVIQAGDFNAPDQVLMELEYTDAIGRRYTTPINDGPHQTRQPLGASSLRRKQLSVVQGGSNEWKVGGHWLKVGA